MRQRPPEHNRTPFVDHLFERIFAQHHPSARASQSFVRRRRDDMSMGNWVIIPFHHFSCDKAGKMGHVDHESRSHAVCNLAHLGEVDQAWVS